MSTPFINDNDEDLNTLTINENFGKKLERRGSQQKVQKWETRLEQSPLSAGPFMQLVKSANAARISLAKLIVEKRKASSDESLKNIQQQEISILRSGIDSIKLALYICKSMNMKINMEDPVIKKQLQLCASKQDIEDIDKHLINSLLESPEIKQQIKQCFRWVKKQIFTQDESQRKAPHEPTVKKVTREAPTPPESSVSSTLHSNTPPLTRLKVKGRGCGAKRGLDPITGEPNENEKHASWKLKRLNRLKQQALVSASLQGRVADVVEVRDSNLL
jgi:hypothetical protein